MQRLELKIPPPLLFLIHAGLMWMICQYWPQLSIDFPYRIILSGACLALFSLFGAAALWAFIRSKATVNPLQPQKSSVLVTDGIYGVSRNPMYLSLIGLLFAWGIWLANLGAMALPFVCLIYLTRFQIKPEETLLQRHFGETFARYKRNVRRWL
jgi:protein-S-isoprenylcysteine O-methyltransferase Ste14